MFQSFDSIFYWPNIFWGSSAMSAIGIVAIPAGFIIAADGRMRLDDDSRAKADEHALAQESETAQKIFPIKTAGGMLAFTITGTVASDDLRFRLWEETQKCAEQLEGKNFPDAFSYLESLSLNLNAVINSASHAGIMPFPKTHKLEQSSIQTIARIFFAGYFNSEPCLFHVDFYHFDGVTSEKPRIIPIEYTYWHRILLGPEKIKSAMYDDCNGFVIENSPFAAYTEPLVMQSSLDDAKRFVDGYIKACCTPLALNMDETCKTVGGHIHIAKITPEKGFEWETPPFPEFRKHLTAL
jgi:hypothetical protein